MCKKIYPRRLMTTLLVAIFLLNFTLFSLAASHTRNEWIDRYNNLDTNLNNGNGFAASEDSATLAWAESYILLSYLNMYEATNNDAYLNKFVEQVDTMLSSATDADNDGYKGWDTARYSVNLVRNNGAEDIDMDDVNNDIAKTLILNEDFENPSSSDATLPTGWTRWQASPATAYLDNANADTGTYGCTIYTDPNTGWQILEKDITYEPGKFYLLKFRGKISGTGAKGYLVISDFSNSTTLGKITFSSSEWQDYEVLFKAPAESMHTVKVRLYHTAWNINNFASHFDNLQIYRIDSNFLPKYWTRWQATSQTAYIDYSMNDAPAGKAVFTIKTDPNYGWQVLMTDLKNLLVNDNQNYEPGIKYNISFYAKSSDSATDWRFSIYDFTARKTLLNVIGNNTAWDKFTYSVTMPSEPDHDIKIRLFHSDWRQTGSAHFDNIKVNQYAEYTVHDAMIATPLAKFVMLAYRGFLPMAYQSDADRFVDFMEQHLFPKWDNLLTDIDSDRSVYRAPDNGSLLQPNSSLPHNQYLAMTVVYSFMARAFAGAKAETYAAKAQKLINTFISQLHLDNVANTYEWNYWDNLLPVDNINSNIEDTSHANIDINGAIQCYNAGIAITKADLKRFANSFTKKMWNKDINDPTIGKRVNSTVVDPAYQYTMWGWIKLGIVNSQIYDIIKNMYDAAWDDQTIINWYKMLTISEIIKGKAIMYEDFETPSPSDATLPAGWTRWQATTATAYLDSNYNFYGNNGLTVKTNPSAGWQVLQKAVNYTPGANYQLSFLSKVSSSNNGGGRCVIYDFTAGKTLALVNFTNSDWQLKTTTFTAPTTTGNNIQIRLYTTKYDEPNLIVHFDNIEIRKIE